MRTYIWAFSIAFWGRGRALHILHTNLTTGACRAANQRLQDHAGTACTDNVSDAPVLWDPVLDSPKP